MTTRALRRTVVLAALCAAAAVSLLVPAASAVLPGDGGGGGYVSCSLSYTTYRGHIHEQIGCPGYRAGFSAYNPTPAYQTDCWQWGYQAKVLDYNWNQLWAGGPYCNDGTWHYSAAWTYNRNLIADMNLWTYGTDYTITIYRLA